MNPKISVVLPTYNGEKYLAKSIESIINQTYHNWELIIVNDCSTDNTFSIAQKYVDKDSRIRVVSNNANLKLPKSLNIGFECSTGEYRTWTSDDNMYHNNALECMLRCFMLDTELDFIYSSFNIIDSCDNIVKQVIDDSPSCLKYHNTVGACFMYRKSLADKIGNFDTSLFLAEDYEYWIRAFLNGKMKQIEDCLYDYREHNESLTATKMKEIKDATFKAKNKYFYELLDTCKTQDERNEFYCKMLEFVMDENEKRRIRRQYYKIDKSFAKTDIIRRLNNRLQFN